MKAGGAGRFIEKIFFFGFVFQQLEQLDGNYRKRKKRKIKNQKIKEIVSSLGLRK